MHVTQKPSLPMRLPICRNRVLDRVIAFTCVVLCMAAPCKAQHDSVTEYYKGIVNDELSLYNDSVFLYIDSLEVYGGRAAWEARYMRACAYSLRQKKKEEAIQLANSCITYFRSVNDTAAWLHTLRLIAYTNQDLSDYLGAIETMNEGIRLALEAKDTVEMSLFESELGYIYLSVLDDHELSLQHLMRSYEMSLQVGDWVNTSRAVCYLMEYFLAVGDTAKAGEYAHLALQYSKELDSTSVEAYDGNVTMGYYSLWTGNFDKAIEQAEVIAAKGWELEDRDMYAIGRIILAESYFNRGEFRTAYQNSKEAVAAANDVGDIVSLENAYRLHWRICDTLNLSGEALIALKRYQQHAKVYNDESIRVDMMKRLYKGEVERERIEKEKVELTLALAKENARFQSLLLISALGLLVALLVFIYVIVHRNRKEKEYNRTLEASNEVVLRQKQNLEMNLDELKKDLQEKEREADSYYFAQSAIQIKFSEIIALESSNNYVLIHVEGRKNPLLERVKMKDLTEHFPSTLFVRIHRSYYVNVEHIVSRPSKYVIKMSNDMVLNVSRGHAEDLGDRFLQQGAV